MHSPTPAACKDMRGMLRGYVPFFFNALAKRRYTAARSRAKGSSEPWRSQGVAPVPVTLLAVDVPAPVWDQLVEPRLTFGGGAFTGGGSTEQRGGPRASAGRTEWPTSMISPVTTRDGEPRIQTTTSQEIWSPVWILAN